MELVDDIKAKIGKIKYFNLLVIDLEYDLENPNYLKSMMWSAYFAYFLSKNEILCKILNSFINIEFDGNYDKWTWIEGGLIIMYRIGSEMQIENNDVCISKKILDTLNFGDSDIKKKINRKAFTRRMNGESLVNYCGKAHAAFLNSDLELEFIYLMGYYKELLFIYVLGGSDNYPLEQLSIRLNATETKIKSFLRE